MNTICNRDLLQLVEYSDDFCASLYLPLYTGAESRQNTTRLKKLLRTAEATLKRRGASPSIVQDALTSANELMGRLTFGEEGGEAGEEGRRESPDPGQSPGLRQARR